MQNFLSRLSHLIVAKVSRYVESHGIMFFFPARNGANLAVAKKKDGTYWVLMFKPNKIMSSHILDHLNELDTRQMLALLIRYAADKQILKKNLPSVTGKELGTLLIQKQGMHIQTFQRLFPELKTVSTEDAIEIEGMKIVYAENIRNRDTILQNIKKSLEIVKSSGFSHLLYGNIFLIGSAMGKTRAADYSPTTDEIRVKLESKDHIIHSVLHELGHRQFYKFKVDKAALNEKYNTIVSEKTSLKPGDVVIHPKTGTEYEVVTLNFRGKKPYKVTWGEGKRGDAGDFIEDWPKKNSDPKPKNVFDVSRYARTNTSEFWAEVFATALQTKNSELMNWVQSLT